jgi:hypothetical protein
LAKLLHPQFTGNLRHTSLRRLRRWRSRKAIVDGTIKALEPSRRRVEGIHIRFAIRIAPAFLGFVATTGCGAISKAPDRISYVDHFSGTGKALFEKACKMDLEGIVAKHKRGK